jgi:hypothetical protein
MPYVRRDAQGRLTSLHREDAGGLEFLPDDHADVRGFVGLAIGAPVEAAPAAAATQQFAALDADFVRVIEDVIDTLIVRNVINITDLPAEAQNKLFSRKSFRERVSQQSLRLFGDGGAADSGTV